MKLKQELNEAFEQGRQAYLQIPADYDNPYLADFNGMKAGAWDRGFEQAMVELARGE
jgi:hypothetical protein